MADPAAYYLEVIANERDDYYLGSGEAPGRWVGGGAGRLGLTGVVKADALRSVLEGQDPSSGEPLTGWRKIKGFDPTLPAPKNMVPNRPMAVSKRPVLLAVGRAHRRDRRVGPSGSRRRPSR